MNDLLVMFASTIRYLNNKPFVLWVGCSPTLVGVG
jgi:hypothetical protein